MSEALKIEGLQKTYENGFEALKGIDLSVEPGDFFALLGPNGAGKSTTIGIVSSLVAKSAGKVWVHGVDIDKDFPEPSGIWASCHRNSTSTSSRKLRIS